MNWRDLITDAGTGQVSHTKLWSNLGLVVVTLAVIALTVKVVFTPVDASSTVFFDAYVGLIVMFLALVCVNAGASKAISLGMGKSRLNIKGKTR